MELQLYNSLSKRKEVFKPIIDGAVGIYTCGPTVYDYSHIGNFRTFVFEDLLKRWLLHLEYDVLHIMNITDLDDKTIARAKRENTDLGSITNRFTNYFLKDLEWLKIIPADQFPRATKSINRIIEIIKVLLEKKHAYVESDGSVYFDIQSYSGYGSLAKVKIKNKKAINRVIDDEYSKESPHDFALWKGWKEEDGEVVWDSPWGKGRPGWHIECSAMSFEALGPHFDIHCGGVDNMFPHHENEIAQSICYTENKFVNYWLHSEFLLVDGAKMSKSLDNFYTIGDLKDIGFSSESVRYQLLIGHYRSKISFSFSKKQESDKIIQRLINFRSLLEENNAQVENDDALPGSYLEFRNAMNDDLNAPKALGIFFSWMKKEAIRIKNGSCSEISINSAWNYLNAFNSIFALIPEKKLNVPEKIKKLINIRENARIEKDWSLSDKLRKAINNEGWIVEDTSSGQSLKKDDRIKY